MPTRGPRAEHPPTFQEASARARACTACSRGRGHDRGRPGRRRHRPQRLGQVDAAEPHQRHRRAGVRHVDGRRHRGDRAQGAGAHPVPPRAHRLRLPVLQPHPHARRAGERAPGAGAQRRARRARRAAQPRHRSPSSGSPGASTAASTSSPAASSSAWRSPARWCTAPGCCSPTSRPATSMRPPRARCCRRCCRSRARAGRRC